MTELSLLKINQFPLNANSDDLIDQIAEFILLSQPHYIWAVDYYIIWLYVVVTKQICRNVIIEPAHDKTYNKTCATSEDSDWSAQSDKDLHCSDVLLQPSGYLKRDKREPLP